MSASQNNFGFVADDMPQNKFDFVEDATAPSFAEEQPKGLLQRAAESPGVQFALGLGSGFQKPFMYAGNIINRKLGLPELKPFGPDEESFAGAVGEVTGGLVPLGLAGKATMAGTQALLKGAQEFPLAAKTAGYLLRSGMGQKIGNIAGGAGIGALMSPEDRTTGALGTAAIVGAMEGLAPGFKLAKKLATPIMPKVFGEKILSGLSEGKSLSENAKGLAEDIRNSFKKNVAQGVELYAPINEAAQGTTIKLIDFTKKFADNSGIINPDTLAALGKNNKINTLFTDFVNDPSYAKAHNLQSQLGTKIREFQALDVRKNLGSHDRDLMERYMDIRNSLKNDIKSTLGTIDENLSKMYDAATNFWDKNVAVYYENPKISAMAKGEITDPRNVVNIFRNPEEDIQKVASDIGRKGMNKILFSELGKYETPEGLLNAIGKLDQKGLSHYETDELRKQFSELNNKIKNKQIAKTVGITGASVLGLSSSIPILKAMIGQ